MKRKSLIFLLLAYAGLWFLCRSTVEYTVTFEPNGGTLLDGELVQIVKIGKAAQAPTLDNGRLALRWEGEFDKVRADTIVTAQWDKVSLSKEAVAAYVRPRTVLIHAVDPKGEESLSAGFFLNDTGRVAASFRAIAGAETLRVELSDGSLCEVETVSGHDRLWDLVMLETGLEDTPWLELATNVCEGQPVYSWTRSLKSLRSGTIVNTGTAIGDAACVETTLPALFGGCPLVDEYGDVVAIHHGLDFDQSLAVTPGALSTLPLDTDQTPEKFRAWHSTERSRSYELREGDAFRPIMARTYHLVTGTECSYSLLEGSRYEGYFLRSDSYIYEYFQPELEDYLEYLNQIGYELVEKTEQDGTTLYRCLCPIERAELCLTVREATSELEIRVAAAMEETPRTMAENSRNG